MTRPPRKFSGPLINIGLFATLGLVGVVAVLAVMRSEYFVAVESKPPAVEAVAAVEPGSNAASAAPMTSAARPRRLLLLLPSRGLWFGDFRNLRDAVAAADRSAGLDAQMVIAGTSLQPVQLEPKSEPGVVRADVLLHSQLRAAPFDALLVVGYDNSELAPGGAAADETLRLIEEFRSQGKIIASLCAGQRVLAQHDLVRGKQIAVCKYVNAGEIANRGGTPIDQPVVVDGWLITAGNEADAPLLVEKIMKSINR